MDFCTSRVLSPLVVILISVFITYSKLRPIHAAEVCNSHFLVTAENSTAGVEVRIFPGGDGKLMDYERKEITNRHLTPDCGPNFAHCNVPAVVNIARASATGELQEQIVLLSLMKAIGVLRLKINRDGMLFVAETHVEELAETYNCNPMSMYGIRNSYYVLCLNREESYIKFLRLHLNTTHLDKLRINNLETTTQVYDVANSVLVYLYDEPYIFFAAGYELLAFTPFSHVVQSWDVSLERRNCNVSALDNVENKELLLYCQHGESLYVDLNEEEVNEVIDNAKDGLPFVCPNPDVLLSVNTRADYIQYGLLSETSVKNFQIPMLSFDNGVCFGSRNETLFAYVDREEGVRLLRVPQGSISTLSDTSCINYPCQNLIVLQQNYLVIREKRGLNWFILVLDTKNNFSVVIEGFNSPVDMLALIENNDTCKFNAISDHNINVSDGEKIPDQESSTSSKSGTNQLAYIIPTAVVGLAVLVLTTFPILYVFRGRLFFRLTRMRTGAEQGHSIAECNVGQDKLQGQPLPSGKRDNEISIVLSPFQLNQGSSDRESQAVKGLVFELQEVCKESDDQLSSVQDSRSQEANKESDDHSVQVSGVVLNDEFIPAIMPLSEERAEAEALKKKPKRYDSSISEADPLLSSSSSSASI